MGKIILALFMGALVADTAWCHFENWDLKQSIHKTVALDERIQANTRKYEAALLSCRGVVDQFVTQAEQDTTRRVFFEIGTWRLIKRQKTSDQDKLVAMAKSGWDDAFQAQQ